ncbi:hypothetical protein Prudu_001404, partial [Prunus dulcis]
QLTLSLRETGRRLPEAAGAASELQWPRDRWRWNRHRVPYLFQPISTRALLSWPKNRVFRRRFVRSYSNFQLEILLRFSTNRSSKAPGARQDCKRDLRRVKVARTICVEVRGIHNRAIHSFRVSNQVKNFGIGQNTGETLLNFGRSLREF